MTDRATARQLARLSAALHVPVERLDHLAALDIEDLAVLTDRVLARLHARYAARYRRLYRLGRRFPQRRAVPFAVRLLPPRLLGRVITAALSDEHDVDTAAESLNSIDPTVIADAAPFIDPAAIGRAAHLTSSEVVGEVMAELLRRQDFATADLFVDYMTAHMNAPATEPAVPAAPTPRRLGDRLTAFAKRGRS
ncbi:hypothetical protein IU449_25135 [Nocardia higoensis]|uniref:Uncharacterized protein n=1 Tax=Nocardia higoensis TaxID=228599 RepID=A0ABS0DH46_9NOCA|nr:hypothetical protein [Nocardia higoensis]MBF6357787.1 hypothetical protein [Nocardia higoensis]